MWDRFARTLRGLQGMGSIMIPTRLYNNLSNSEHMLFNMLIYIYVYIYIFFNIYILIHVYK